MELIAQANASGINACIIEKGHSQWENTLHMYEQYRTLNEYIERKEIIFSTSDIFRLQIFSISPQHDIHVKVRIRCVGNDGVKHTLVAGYRASAVLAILVVEFL